MIPTTRSIMPTVCKLMPDVVAVTAHRRIAPAAMSRMLTVSPMGSSLVCRGESLHGSFGSYPGSTMSNIAMQHTKTRDVVNTSVNTPVSTGDSNLADSINDDYASSVSTRRSRRPCACPSDIDNSIRERARSFSKAMNAGPTS